MSYRSLVMSATIALVITLAGCSGATTPSPVLPTTTPAPTAVRPTATPTPLPPPTVTPYPTATTPADSVPLVPTTASEALGTSIPPSPVSPTQPAGIPTLGSGGLPAGVQQGQVIFSADFYQGWPSIQDTSAKIYLSNGQYVFEVGPYDGRFIATTAINRSDLYAQVEATPIECVTNGGYGLMFRFADAGNYYLLTVFCDNSFSVVSKIGGTFAGGVALTGTLPAGLDAASSTTHTLGVLSRANTHTLYFDGQAIASFSDDRLQQGDVAVYAVSEGSDVLKVAFDNLKVWATQ
jgi:hypothetical protein